MRSLATVMINITFSSAGAKKSCILDWPDIIQLVVPAFCKCTELLELDIDE